MTLTSAPPLRYVIENVLGLVSTRCRLEAPIRYTLRTLCVRIMCLHYAHLMHPLRTHNVGHYSDFYSWHKLQTSYLISGNGIYFFLLDLGRKLDPFSICNTH